MSLLLPSQNQGVWVRCTTSKQQEQTQGPLYRCTSYPEASIVKHERGCPFYKPGPATIQVVGDGPVQSPMEHLTPKPHHSLRAVNNGWEAKQEKQFILGFQHHMNRIDETSKKLLDLFLCKEERQQQFIRNTMQEINEENQLRQWGVTQANLWTGNSPRLPLLVLKQQQQARTQLSW